MAYLDSSRREEILSEYKHTLPHLSMSDLLTELAKLENALLTELAKLENAFLTELAKLENALLTELAKLENAFRFLAFAGSNGAGACTLTGAKVGDRVIGVINLTDGATASSSFEATITVADQIQQSEAADLSTKDFAVLLVAKS